ncbi:hypothetical protein ATI61_108335 [Archangium gephyra]|uniref:Uncharacterized protein n=1 Tax=Archangium gephyra TaxID=48 RepID=A0AAC8Q7I5_9BACT|nr:Hypothetical protein AA314_03902 [Archangium gephyra]REG28793.1 hypothetical protein ATI61_108335 [Archangium gephyra]
MSTTATAVPAPSVSRVPRDFYEELVRASQGNRAGFLTERERWLRALSVEAREELLFEFEMLLRGVERYVHLYDNGVVDPQDKPLVTRDFREELKDVRATLSQAIRLARHLLDPDSDQKLQFRRYVETQLADDNMRRSRIEGELDQETPQESLFVLRQSFESLRNLIDHLLQLPVCGLSLFNDVGNLVLREIVLNRYFRPFRLTEFRLEYDRLRSVRLLSLLSTVPVETRPLFTTAYLSLFRLLHYLAYVSQDTQGPIPRRVRVLLTLVRSEALGLVAYLKNELAPKAGPKPLQAACLRAARDIARETERIARDVLVELDRDRAAAARASYSFTQLFQTQVVALTEALSPGAATGEAPFEQLASPMEAAERLRKDLWVFSQLCRAAEGHLRNDDVTSAEAVISSIVAFLGYFQDGSYQLLRYVDYEAFDRFSALLTELPWPPEGPAVRTRLIEDLRSFSMVLENTFAAVSRRAQLRGFNFDRAEAELLRDRFLAATR